MIVSPSSYICYYGPGQLATLARADWVIVQGGHYSTAELAWLAEQGTVTFAYLSLGEERLEIEKHGRVPQPWHIQHNPQWSTYFVDCRHQAWQNHILSEIVPALSAQGFAGLLLDTLDVQEQFPETRPGVKTLIHQLHHHFPHLRLIANRGFSLLPDITSVLSAWLFESFSSYHDGDTCQPWPAQDEPWLQLQAERLRQTGLPLLALDYANPDQPELLTYAHGRARTAGFLPYVTNYALDWLSCQPVT
jgi:polysaccharide biosynthesis protein PelA